MIYVASVIMIVGFLILGFIPNGSIVVIVLAIILTFMSYSAIQVSLNTFIPKTLHAAKVGVGLGLYNLINFFGMAFGPAVASKIMESTNSYRFNFILIVMLISAHFFLLIGMSSFQKDGALKMYFIIEETDFHIEGRLFSVLQIMKKGAK